MRESLAGKRMRLRLIVVLAVAWVALYLFYFWHDAGKSLAMDTLVIIGSICMAVLCGMNIAALTKNIISGDIDDFMLESANYFFHGLDLARYVVNGSFKRMGEWAKDNFSYEAAAIAMIILKDNKSAILHHGIYKGERNSKLHIMDKHAWVEFRIGLRLYVADLTTDRVIYSRREYFGEDGPGEGLVSKWRCGYDDFWVLAFTSAVHDAMLVPETSYVMKELSGFGSPIMSMPGFENWVARVDGLYFSDGTHMEPYVREHVVLTSEIIRDFGKKHNRQQPKSKSMRRAKREIRKSWLSKHEKT